jgi:hypothetical protein
MDQHIETGPLQAKKIAGDSLLITEAQATLQKARHAAREASAMSTTNLVHDKSVTIGMDGCTTIDKNVGSTAGCP